jgi:hypothetical protein
MIEIPIFYVKAIVAIALCTVSWAVIWAMLGILEYPENPSWRTAVPAAVIVLFVLLCVVEVIVFV